MLIIQIALGIVLGVLILVYFEAILALGLIALMLIVAVAVIAAVVYYVGPQLDVVLYSLLAIVGVLFAVSIFGLLYCQLPNVKIKHPNRPSLASLRTTEKSFSEQVGTFLGYYFPIGFYPLLVAGFGYLIGYGLWLSGLNNSMQFAAILIGGLFGMTAIGFITVRLPYIRAHFPNPKRLTREEGSHTSLMTHIGDLLSAYIGIGLASALGFGTLFAMLTLAAINIFR